MKTLKISIIIFAFSFSSLWVNAQSGWTLEECIDYAVKHNIQIKRAELSAKVADYDLTKAKADFTPTLFAFGRHGINKGLGYNFWTSTYEDREFQSGQFGLQGNFDLFKGGAKINGLSRSKLNLQAALEDVEHQKNVLVLNIVAVYLQVLYSNEMLTLAKEQLELAELRHSKAKTQLELGQLSQAQYLEVNAQLANERRILVTTDNDRKMALLSLAQLLELEAVEDFTINISREVKLNDVSMDFSLGQILDSAYETMPQLKASEFRYQLSKKDYRIAQGLRAPSIYLTYDYTSRYSQSATDPFAFLLRPYPNYTYREQISDNAFGGIFLAIDIPIFNKFVAQNQISKAKIRVSDAELQQEQVRKDILKTVQQSYLDAVAAKENYNQLLISVDNYSEVFNMTSRRFDLGQASAVDLGVAKANFIGAQAELLNAKYTYILRVKILDFYKGSPITL
jgi:outer membrane protein